MENNYKIKLIQSSNPNWMTTDDLSFFAHKNGTLVKKVSGACRKCTKKYVLNHPNIIGGAKLIVASGSLQGKKLENFVIGKAEKIMVDSDYSNDLLTPSMRLCIDCGTVATLYHGCECGKTMADKNGMVAIGATDEVMKGTIIELSMSMPGFKKRKLIFLKNEIPPNFLAEIRKRKDEGTTGRFALQVPYLKLANQLIDAMRKEQINEK